MKRFGRRTLSAFLSLVLMLCMAVGLMPMAAQADGYGDKGYDTTLYDSHRIDGNDVYTYVTGHGGAVERISGGDNDSVQQYRAVASENWEFAYWSTYYVGPVTQHANPVATLGYYYFSKPGDADSAYDKTNSVIQVNEEMWATGIYYLQAIFKPKVTVSVNLDLPASGQSIRGNSPATDLDSVFISGSSGYVPFGGSIEVTLTAFKEDYVVQSITVHDGAPRNDFTYAIDSEHDELGVFFTATRPTNVQINVKIKEQVLVFDANGGSGSMATQSFDSGLAKALTGNAFTKAGYVFAGWNTAADGSGTAYGDRQEVSFSPADDGELLTLYAQWKEPVAAQDNMVTIGQTEFTYNGGEQKPALSVEYEGAALTEGTDYTVTWPEDCTNAGAKEVVIDFAGLYSGRVTKSYTISPADLADAVVTISPDSFVYNGQAQKPTVTIEYKGVTLTEGVDYTAFFQADVMKWEGGVPTKWFNPYYDCIHPETVYAMGRGMGNYTGFSPYQTFEIEKAPLTVTANDTAVTYGDALTDNGAICTGFITGEGPDDLDGTLDYDYGCPADADAGSYDITPKGLSSEDYEITFASGVLTVEPRAIGIKWSNTELFHKPGTAQAPTAAATNTVFGDVLSLEVSGAQEAVGTYTATVTAIGGEKAANYRLPDDVTADFSIRSLPTTPTPTPTPPPAPTDAPVGGSDVPPTGDDAHPALWLGLMGGCGLALAAPGIRRRKSAAR